MRSVAARLLLSFLLVTAVGIGAVAFLANRATTEDFTTYVQSGRYAYLERVADSLSGYYTQEGSWTGVSSLIDSLRTTSGERLVLANNEGVVLADSAGALNGLPVSGFEASNSATISADGREIGTVYLAPSGNTGTMGLGQGPGRSRGFSGLGSGGQSATVAGGSLPATAEQHYLDTINHSLWIAALAAGALAVGLGLFLTFQIVRPLRALTVGAQRIAQGDLGTRVAMKSGDELGTLGAAFDTMAEKLERDEYLRRSLMADITHELRTPLSIIEGTADGILDQVLEPTAENIATIKEEAQLLNRLIADLRELALAEAGELRLNLEPTAVGDLVERAAHRWDNAAQERGVELSIQIHDRETPANVDAARLTQVIGNLLSNAIRHTPAGRRVTVDVARQNAEMVIAVLDTGEGITAEDLPYVFERFYRGDKSRTRRSGGSGLGLAIVKQLVQAHGGGVWAESGIENGSRFYVALPTNHPLD